MQHLIRGAMSLLHFSWIALWLSTVVNTFQVTAIENIFMYVYLNGMHIHLYFFQTIDRGDVIRDVSTNDHPKTVEQLQPTSFDEFILHRTKHVEKCMTLVENLPGPAMMSQMSSRRVVGKVAWKLGRATGHSRICMYIA